MLGLVMRRWVGVECLVAVASSITAIMSCRQLAGIQDSPPEALTTNVCGLPYGTNECAACANKNCCSESTTCAADPQCAAYESCLGNCKGDAECRSKCTIGYPTGVATNVTALSTCLASSCETACNLTCGGIAALISPPSAAKACEECLATSACSKAEACASSTVCDAYERGNYAFPTIDSDEVYEANLCASDGATGLSLNIGSVVDVCGAHAKFDEDAGISSTAAGFNFDCAAACATGNDWGCIGHVSWPPPKVSSCTVNYIVRDFSGPPVNGALLQVCSPSHHECTEPLALGTTDANGALSLLVPNPLVSGSQGLNGFTRISGPNLLTENVYWGFPLVEGAFPVLRMDVVTVAEDQTILSGFKVTPIDGRGQLTVQVADCLFAPAAGVNVALKTADTYTMGFSTTTGNVTTVTDPSGLIFFVNVPAGLTPITATPTGLAAPAAQATVYVEPGVATVVYLWKMPSQ